MADAVKHLHEPVGNMVFLDSIYGNDSYDGYSQNRAKKTLQSAIDAAQLLPKATWDGVENEATGVAIQVYPGNASIYGDGLIRGNISIDAVVQNTVQLGNLTYRPALSGTNGPNSCRISNVSFASLTVSNETNSGSGIYWDKMFNQELLMEDTTCQGTQTLRGANYISYQGGYVAGSTIITNVVGLFPNFTSFGNITQTVDSTLSGLPNAFSSIESLGFIMRDGYAANMTITGGVSSTKKSTIQIANATINSITYTTTNTKRNLVGCVIGAQILTATPTTVANTMASIYTAGAAGSWAGSAPVTQEAAIDRIAALVKTLNGGTAIP